MKPPSQKDIQKHILESMTAAKAPPLPLDIHGSGEFRWHKFVAQWKERLRDFRDTLIPPFDYVRVSQEALDYIKGYTVKQNGHSLTNDVPGLFYGIPMVLIGSALDMKWTAEGKRAIEIN
jgi:hypothetical protein